MRILALSPIIPDAPSDGDKLRLYHFLKNLSKRHSVTLAAFGDPETQQEDLSSFVQGVHVLPMPRYRPWVNAFSRLLFETPSNVNAYASDAMREQVDTLLAAGKFDAVFCYRLRMVPYALRSRLPRVLDCTDSLTRYWERKALAATGFKRSLFKREAEKIAGYEAWAAGQFDAVCMNSSQDSATLKAMAPHAHVLTVSNGADFERLKPALRLRRDPERMIFIGNLAYEPNAKGVLWFYREVLPKILARRPRAKFVVVGGNASENLSVLKTDPHVELVGFASDMSPLLNASGLSVCPVHLAAGRQNKILDAFATATPVVATGLTALGVEARPGRELLAADSAADFAAAALKIMDSPVLARRLGQAGYKFVRRHYDWASSARLIEKAFQTR